MAEITFEKNAVIEYERGVKFRFLFDGLPCVGGVSGKALDDHVGSEGHPIERFSQIRDRIEVLIRERMDGLETRPLGYVLIHSADI